MADFLRQTSTYMLPKLFSKACLARAPSMRTWQQLSIFNTYMHTKVIWSTGTTQGQYINPDLIFLGSKYPSNYNRRRKEKGTIIVMKTPQLLVAMHVYIVEATWKRFFPKLTPRKMAYMKEHWGLRMRPVKIRKQTPQMKAYSKEVTAEHLCRQSKTAHPISASVFWILHRAMLPITWINRVMNVYSDCELLHQDNKPGSAPRSSSSRLGSPCICKEVEGWRMHILPLWISLLLQEALEHCAAGWHPPTMLCFHY